MSTETPKPSLAPWIMVALALAAAAGMVGYALARKQAGGAASLPDLVAQVPSLEARQRDLEAQIKDLKRTIASLESQQAQPAPRAPATDPALAAQLGALASSMAAMAEAQKAQQAALAQLAAKPAAQPATTTTAPASHQDLLLGPPEPWPKPTEIKKPGPPPVAAPANSVEAAYKQAWETGKPVIVGQVKNPRTGQLEGGRTLDPAQAKVLGLASWQEWYATEEKARRAELETQAGKELEHLENTLVEIPKNPKP